MTTFYKYRAIRKSTCMLFAFFFFTALSKGQCPDKNFLEKRIVYLRDSSTLPNKVKLAELLGYLGNMKNCPYRNDSTHARLVRRIGWIYHLQAEYFKAVEYFSLSINIISANINSPTVNITDLPGAYYWLSTMYDSLSNIPEKMRALDSCYTIAMRIKYIDPSSLKALYILIEHYFDLGDYHRCMDYAKQCELHAREYAKNNEAMRLTGEEYAWSSLLWRVKALLELKNYEDAEKLLANKMDEYSQSGHKSNLGTIASQLAEIYIRKGNYKQALLYYQKAFAYDHRADYDFNCKQTLKDIGHNIYFLHANDGDKAKAYYTRALGVINKDESLHSEDISESLDLFRLIGNVFSQKGQYDSAYRYFQLAFDQIDPGIDEAVILHGSQEKITQFKKIHYLTRLVIDKADAYRRQYEATKKIRALQEAIRIYKIADQFLDKIKEGQSDLQSKLFWRSDSRRLYENAINTCYLSNNMADAFYFFEKSRAVLLNDQLNEQRWMGGNDILKQTQLKKKILRLERELNIAGTSAEQPAALKSEIFAAKQELDRLEQLIRVSNPLYYQSFLDTGSITLRYVQQKLLKDHHALLEIFSGDSAVYALLVTDKKSSLTKINKQDFETAAAKYISYISNANLMNQEFAGFVSTSTHLYNLLFQNSTLPGNRIIISPDGQYFPFEALVTNKTNQPPAYFIKDHAVSYTYSARFLMNDFKSGSTTGGKNFMGMAPVNYPSTFSLADLPGSDQSLHKISNYFDNAVNQTASHASRNNFMLQFSQYRIIQLYTHASDSSSNNEPVIYFADSALYLSDLINEYKPLTRLIVLSACETGTGKNYQGEGVFSFNRGFAALGIPAAITNLWSVDNGSTYLLTELFYKWLAKGLPTDIALQKAKLEFLKVASKEKSMPCYWAGPVLVGKTDTIELSKSFSWKWIALFLAIGCIAFFTLGKWAISKKIV